MIFDAAEKPVPPTEIVARLKQIDPRLGLTFGQTVDRETGRMRNAWGISMDWLMTDPRRAAVGRGELPLDACFDVLAYLPEDCGVDEAYGYIVATFRQFSGRDDIKGFLERVHTFNRQAQREATREVVELATELAEANAPTLFRDQGKAIPKVSAVTHRRVETPEKRERKLREFLDQ